MKNNLYKLADFYTFLPTGIKKWKKCKICNGILVLKSLLNFRTSFLQRDTFLSIIEVLSINNPLITHKYRNKIR